MTKDIQSIQLQIQKLQTMLQSFYDFQSTPLAQDIAQFIQKEKDLQIQYILRPLDGTQKSLLDTEYRKGRLQTLSTIFHQYQQYLQTALSKLEEPTKRGIK